MNESRFPVVVLSLVMLAGCAYIGRPVDTPFPSPDPHFTVAKMAIEQKIIFSRGRETHTWLTHTELEDDRITVIAFGRLGNKVFDILLEDGEVRSHGRFNAVSPGQFLSDMQMAFGQGRLTAGFDIVEESAGKRISYRGMPYERISYRSGKRTAPGHWNDTVRIENFLQGYTMTIVPLHIDKR